jgi:acyl-CoA thioesterase-1
VIVTRRGAALAVGAALVLAAVLTVLASGGATGADAERCATFATQSQARERLVGGSGQRVVVIGDSYSVGLGLRDPASSWPDRLPGRVHVFGFSGSGFSAHASPCGRVSYADRAPRAVSDGADLVVVEGGLNDYDQPAGAITAGFRTLVRELHGMRVLVVGPAAAPSRAVAAERVDALLRAESARAGVPYLSMTQDRFGYLDDRLHLTATGHRMFGDVVRAALEHRPGLPENQRAQ